MRRSRILAGVGSIAFGVLTFLAALVGNAPGGAYKASNAQSYVATGHLPAVLVAEALAMLGVLGLICLLAYLRQAITVAPNNQLAASICWGTGLGASAAFAVGWGVLPALPYAQAVGGSDVGITPGMTYLISEVGLAIIFGPGAILLGFALIALMLGSRTTLPAWLRWLTLVAGVLGLTSLAFFPFSLLLIWGIVIGVWLLASGREAGPSGRAAQPSA